MKLCPTNVAILLAVLGLLLNLSGFHLIGSVIGLIGISIYYFLRRSGRR